MRGLIQVRGALVRQRCHILNFIVYKLHNACSLSAKAYNGEIINILIEPH